MGRVMFRALTERLKVWLRREDSRYELSLVVFTLLVRIMTSAVQTGPDPNQKWGFVRQVLAGGFPSAAEYNHHHARWGVHLPQFVVQTLFGQHAVCAAIAPITFAVIQSLLLYKIGRRLNGPFAGVAAAVLTNLLPSSGYMLSVNHTMAFERVYLLATFYAILRSAEVRHSRWLAAACFGAFLSYLAKETTVFALPGLAYFTWISRRRFRDVLVFGGSFVTLFLTETLLYRLKFGFKLGRMTIIKRHHMGQAKLDVPLEFWQLFERYTQLEPVLDFLFYGALVTSLCIPFWFKYKRREAVPTLLLGTLAATWAFYFLTTFALKSINPLTPAQPPLPRYLLPGVPFLALVVGWGLVEWGERLMRPLQSKVNTRHVLVAIPLVAALGVLLVRRPTWETTGIAQTMRIEAEVRAAFLEGDPILVRERKLPIRNLERAVRLLYLTHEQAKHVLVINGPSKTRAIVDRRRPEYKASPAQLSKLVPEWQKLGHVVHRSKAFMVAKLDSEQKVKLGIHDDSKARKKGKNKTR